MSLGYSFHYLMFNMFRMLIHPSSGACDLFVELFHGMYCPGTMCVGVTLWLGCGGVVSGCRLQPSPFSPPPSSPPPSSSPPSLSLLLLFNPPAFIIPLISYFLI